MARCRWHTDETGFRWLVPGCWNRVINGDYADCQCTEPKPKRNYCPECGQRIKEPPEA